MEEKGNSKLTDEKVVEILKAWDKGTSQAVLARRYNVYKSTICKIVHREAWAHVDCQEETL